MELKERACFFVFLEKLLYRVVHSRQLHILVDEYRIIVLRYKSNSSKVNYISSGL